MAARGATALAGANRGCRPSAFDIKKPATVTRVIATMDVNQRHFGCVISLLMEELGLFVDAAIPNSCLVGQVTL